MKAKSRHGGLREWIGVQAAVQDARALHALPTTRSLGARFGVSHGTAFRALCELAESGAVWRHPNGRFYPGMAKRLLDRPKPLAVLLRRMDGWSALCREVMEGFSEECAEHDREILLVFNRRLLSQESPLQAVHIAARRLQKEMLDDFALLRAGEIGGALLDELWSDAALAASWPKGVPAVMFHRPSSVPGIASVVADFKAGALLAFSHLLACGYEEIFLLSPHKEYEAGQSFVEAARAVNREIAGSTFPAQNEIELFDPRQRSALIRKLVETRERCGLICPEDHMAAGLAEDLRKQGVRLGAQHGLMSVMGTSIARDAALTCVRYDFRAMGRAAARLLCQGDTGNVTISPTLLVAETTRPARKDA